MEFFILETTSKQWSSVLMSLQYDFYQLPEYLSLEANRTNSIAKAFLAVEGEKVFFIPFLMRSCQNIIQTKKEIFDVFSPYGYPGILLSEAAKQDNFFCQLALEKFCSFLKEQNVCSAFLRLHPILNENIDAIFNSNVWLENGTTVSIDLTSSPEQMWKDTKPNHRNKINRCLKKFALTAKISKFSEGINSFCQLYEETMSRVAAKDIYYSFNTEYFQQMDCLMSEYLYICLVTSSSGQVASAGLYTKVGKIVQAAFGGISNDFVKQSPSILEIDAVRYWAKQQGCQYLHLGGGVGGSQDSVYQFKAGFSRIRHKFKTMRLIINPKNYHYLVESRAKSLNLESLELYKSNFFPAYRTI